MALRVLVPLHLAACVLVIGLCCTSGSMELLLVCLSILLLTIHVPQVAAKGLGALAHQIFHNTTLPILVFIRAAAVLLVLTLAIWLLVFLGCFPGMP